MICNNNIMMLNFNNKFVNKKIEKKMNDNMKKQLEKKKAYRENKGNWEYNVFQKTFDPNHESKIKMAMRPKNVFNPNDIQQYINPEISREEKIVIRKQNNEKLKTSDQIIYNNYISKKTEALENDINMIKTLEFSAKPVTMEGKIRLLLFTLDSQLKKNNLDYIANIYLRLMEEQFTLSDELKEEYKVQLADMMNIVNKLDIIELQFTKFYSQMPPLNSNAFNKFDDWQIQVINNIDNNISTVVNAPTSAGKTVIAGYAAIKAEKDKGKTLFVVPTDALTWQVASYIESILGTHVPIVTETYQSNPSRDTMIEIMNKANCIVGTAEHIVDYLPFIKNNFKWIIFDEIHMIGKPEGSAMEHIAKILPNIPILALSATIGNTDDLVDWLKSISPTIAIEKVICNKRFFNLQKFYYDSGNNRLNRINPLALIEEENFIDGSILNKTFLPTPPDTWDLLQKLSSKFDMGQLKHTNYFNKNKRIELEEANTYFDKLIKFMVNKYNTNRLLIVNIINSYKSETLLTEPVNLVRLAFKLKSENKTPTIIFQKNTVACLRIARKFAKDIDILENNKYPKLQQDRLKIEKIAKRQEKKIEKTNENINEKKNLKLLMGKLKLKKDVYGSSSISKDNIQEVVKVIPLQEPHADFNFNSNQFFTEYMINEWVTSLKRYFPNNGEYYHYIIKLLWRGVGIYTMGLPEPYLRLVQSLACMKQLAFVFSDMSLVFGVSMPFRTVVILHDEFSKDDLDTMLYHQMSGRAGRRGLDKEGNVIFAGYSWDRIKDLSISMVPTVVGVNNMIYTLQHAKTISSTHNTMIQWENINDNYLDKTTDMEEIKEFSDGIVSNFKGGWNFAFVENDINHLYMNWKLRYSEDCLIVSYIIPFLRRGFEMKDHTLENNQTQLCHFLARFIAIETSDNDTMDEPLILSEAPYNMIIKNLEELQILIPTNIDNKLYLSILSNSLVKCKTELETDNLRSRLLKFSEKVKIIQHYCFHAKIIGLTKILGKLLTRIWWVYHTSSPIMKSISLFDEEQHVFEDSDNED